jgi:hypothetical protein
MNNLPASESVNGKVVDYSADTTVLDREGNFHSVFTMNTFAARVKSPDKTVIVVFPPGARYSESTTLRLVSEIHDTHAHGDVVLLTEEQVRPVNLDNIVIYAGRRSNGWTVRAYEHTEDGRRLWSSERASTLDLALREVADGIKRAAS